jgi:enoyl-CoA hydratase/carnithine racemase
VADLEYRVADGIGTATFNRPEKKNAFTIEMIDRWTEVLRSARVDPEVRVLVLTGAGNAFCAGVDRASFAVAGATPLGLRSVLRDHMHRVALALEDIDKPVIASMPGVAVGAGLDLALGCDIRIAAASARFSEGYIRVGLMPGEGGCWYLPRLVGLGKALELLLTGDFVDAAEAQRIGLVNRVVPDAELDTKTRELADQLAGAPPVTAALIKRTVYQSLETDLRTSLDLVASHAVVTHLTEAAAQAQAEFRG